MRSPLSYVVAGLAGLTTLAACSSHTSASSVNTPISLAVVNARVWTGDTTRPWADAIAVSGDRIAQVGSSAQIRKMADSATRIIDAHGDMLPVFASTMDMAVEDAIHAFSICKVLTDAVKYWESKKNKL